MTGKDLLVVLGDVSHRYYDEAENDTIASSQGYKTLRRPLLIAAVIALIALLVGCGIVYVLTMQDLKLGDQTVTQERWDSDHVAMVTQTVNQQVLTLSGIKGTSNYQAALDWYEFMQSFDPDGSLQMTANRQELDSFDDYGFYAPYAQEMMEKIDEIVKTHDLKLLGSWVIQNGRKDALKSLGIESLLTSEAPAAMDRLSLSATKNGYFTATFQIRPTDGNNDWPYLPMVSYFYTPKDYFNPAIIELNDTGDWEEVNYTTASGYDLLILRSPSDWRSWIFCRRDDAVVYLRMETVWELYSDEGIACQSMTDKELTQILDMIDFSVVPQKCQSVHAETHSSNKGTKQTQNGYALEVKSAVTDGQNARIILTLTVPEGVELCKAESTYSAEFGNFGNFSILTSKVEDDYQRPAMGETLAAFEDHDGRDDTITILYETYSWDADGRICFEPGTEWTVRVQDLYLERIEYPDGVYSGVIPLGTVEGVWEFDITFDEDSDTRAVEFIDEPVTFADHPNRQREVTITSFKLRGLGPEVTWKDDVSGKLADHRIEPARVTCVVLKDGSRIPLDGGDYMVSYDCSPIALDEVDHVELYNGIKLYPQT